MCHRQHSAPNRPGWQIAAPNRAEPSTHHKMSKCQVRPVADGAGADRRRRPEARQTPPLPATTRRSVPRVSATPTTRPAVPRACDGEGSFVVRRSFVLLLGAWFRAFVRLLGDAILAGVRAWTIKVVRSCFGNCQRFLLTTLFFCITIGTVGTREIPNSTRGLWTSTHCCQSWERSRVS
jgi:hypothetical protein